MAKLFGGKKDDERAADPGPPHRPADAGAGEGGHAGPVAGTPPDGGQAAPVAETAPPKKATAAPPPAAKKFKVTLPGRPPVVVAVPAGTADADCTAAAVEAFQREHGIWSLPCPPTVEPHEG